MNKDTKIMLMAFVIILVGCASCNLSYYFNEKGMKCSSQIMQPEYLNDNIQTEFNCASGGSCVFTKDCDVWMCHNDYGCDKFKDTNCKEKR